MEASILGGEIAGAKTAKSIYIIFGSSLFIISGILQLIDKEKKNKKEQTDNEDESKGWYQKWRES